MKYIRDEVRFSGKYSNAVFRTIAMSFKPFKKKFIFFLVLGFVGRAVLLSNTNLIGKWADQHFKNPNSFLALLLLLTSIGFVFYGLFRIGVSRLGTHAASQLYDETTWRVSRFPTSFFDTTPVGRIITRFSSDYNAIFRMAGGPLGEFISICFDLVLFLFLIALASPFYILIIALTVSSNFYIYKLNQSKIRTERREHAAARSPTVSHFAETIQGAKIIRAYGKETSFTQKFLKNFDAYAAQKNRSNMASHFFSLQMSSVNTLILICTALFGLFLQRKGIVSIGSIGVAFTFISMTQTTMQMFFEWMSSLEDAATGTERMSEYLHQTLEPGALLPDSVQFQTGHEKISIHDHHVIESGHFFSIKNSEIQVKSLSVRYHESQPYALDNISFCVHPGEKIGIIGATGSGKTTLIQSLFHLYPFAQGNVSIGGYEAWLDTTKIRRPHEIPLDLFRSAISLITQDPILFTGTLRENLISNKPISDTQIHSLIHSVGFGPWLSKQPSGLDMKIQEKGSNLSLGEKQMVCMLRCFIQETPIVLMDEATSSIDPASEEMMIKASKQILKNKTQIIIAHRLSTIEDCDRILWLHLGKMMMMDKPHLVLSEFNRFEKGNA